MSPVESFAQAADIRAAASLLIDRMQFMRSHGMSFRGMRDLYEVLGYDRNITPRQYRERYMRGGLAGRIVDALPKATWRGTVEVVEDEDPKTKTVFEKAWLDLDKRLRVTSTFLKTDILAGQGRYAVLLLGVPGELSDPIKRGNPDKLVYLTPFSEEDARIQEWETDITSERFGLPTAYLLTRLSANSLNFSSGMPSFTSVDLQKPVHWSRIIHIAEDTLDSEVYGQPTLERVWNLLDDLDKVTGGGAEAFWLRANQGIQLDVDKSLEMSPTEKEALKDQADEYQHQIRRMLRTRGVKVDTLGSDVANFQNPADAVLTQIAGARSIPKRILVGSEAGELASSQDRDNWADQVNGRQLGHAGPNIIRPFVDRCIEFGYLPEPKKGPTEYIVQWPHIEVMSEAEKSTGAKQWADTQGADGPVFSRDEIRDRWYKMEPWPKPVVDAETGDHTSPEGGLPVAPKVDAETGLPLKPKEQQVGAVDPETGLPMMDPKTGLPIVVDPKSKLPVVPDNPNPFVKKPLPFGKKPTAADEAAAKKKAQGRTAMSLTDEEMDAVETLEAALRAGSSFELTIKEPGDDDAGITEKSQTDL